MSHSSTQPFIKWAGGKRQLLDKLCGRMPSAYNKYYEPFVGGGALLFEIKPESAFINDINQELMHTYEAIRDSRDEFISRMEEMDKVTCTKDFYYEIRGRYNEKLSKGEYDVEMAVLFVYLNKHCFNGLYRVNAKGLFNVPWNQKITGKSMDIENIKNISYYLQGVTITCRDFEEALKEAGEHDFVYLDSPYAPLNPTSFEAYTKEGFTIEEHRRLAEVFKSLTEKGCYCMLTNHNTDLIHELYDGFAMEEIDVRRAINSNASKRVGKELIIRNY
jgi:DNA adenine methylase